MSSVRETDRQTDGQTEIHRERQRQRERERKLLPFLDPQYGIASHYNPLKTKILVFIVVNVK